MPINVPLTSFAEEFKLSLLTEGINIEDKTLSHPEINRPALQFAGFFNHFDNDRLQVMGMVEHAYLRHLDKSPQQDNLQKIFAHKIPCMVLCRNLPLLPGMLEYATT